MYTMSVVTMVKNAFLCLASFVTGLPRGREVGVAVAVAVAGGVGGAGTGVFDFRGE